MCGIFGVFIKDKTILREEIASLAKHAQERGSDSSGLILCKDGAYEAIATLITDSYSDNSISSGNTYWYRVFGTNENGEGAGSNVVTLSYSE